MSDLNGVLERSRDRIGSSRLTPDRVYRRRERKERTRRISVAVMALVLVALSSAGLLRAFGGLGGAPATQPTPTPDRGIFSHIGGWIAYGESSGGGIWAVDPERPGVEIQLSHKSGEPLGWSGDGSKLLIYQEDRKGFYLDLLKADGSETRVVTGECCGLSGASLSPDGLKVVYGAAFNSGDYHLYMVDASGGTPRRLGPRGLMGHYPVFSPDGSKIAYFQGGGDYDNTLSVINADGSGSHPVLRAGMMKNSSFGNLAWFPDGRRLLFREFGQDCCPRHPDLIYTINADGSGLTRLGYGPNPTLSPDGSRIAYGDNGHNLGAESLTIENADGTHVQHFDVGAPGPWNPLPYEPRSRGQSTSNPPGATRPDMITYSIVALIAVGIAAFWLRRRRTALTEAKETVE